MIELIREVVSPKLLWGLTLLGLGVCMGVFLVLILLSMFLEDWSKRRFW